jgi:hypothetical protein
MFGYHFQDEFSLQSNLSRIMPSKYRQKSLERRKKYRVNDEKNKPKARISYSQNSDKAKKRATVRRHFDSTARKRDASTAAERMAKHREANSTYRE